MHASEALADIHALAEQGLAEMRTLVLELRPDTLERDGLAAALQKLATDVGTRHRLEVWTTLEPEPGIPLHLKEVLYRVGREALHNAVKHARATSLRLTLATSANEVVLQVADNGRGFVQRASFPGHLGLCSMRERLAKVGGLLEIQSAPGQGTLVQARVPRVSPERARLAVESAQRKVVLDERQRIGHELRKSVSQVLFAIALNSASARQSRHSQAGRFRSALREVHGLAQSALADLRAIIFELRPELVKTQAPVSA
jgi:signal transduction histidine kinase